MCLNSISLVRRPDNIDVSTYLSWVSMKEVRRLTGLEKFGAEQAFEEFAVAADEEGLLDRQSFGECFRRIISTVGSQSGADSQRTQVVLERLFDIFDSDNNGVVDFSDMASGLSVLCSGSRDAKAKAVFSLYDFNGDGFISIDEMTRYLTCVFKVVYETEPGTEERIGVAAEDLAKVTAEEAFDDAWVVPQEAFGLLSFNEFQRWCIHSEV
jgi:Ca2+-binding EF-hand superfamily protein